MRAATLVVLLTIVAGVAGCGGGNDGDTTGSPPLALPKATFVAKANRLCAESLREDELRALRIWEKKARVSGNYGFLRRQEIATVLAPDLVKRAKRVRRLGIPRGDEEQVEEILSTAEKMGQETEVRPMIYKEVKTPYRDVRQLAGAYDIESCAVLLDAHGRFQKVSANPGVRFKPRSSK